MARTEVRGEQIKDATVSLTADVTGTLPQANGGTGAAALTQAIVPDVVSTSSATSLTLSTANTMYEFTGSAAATWTLPAVSGNTGERFTLVNRGSAVVTVTRAGSDSIYGATSGAVTSYALVAGTAVDLVCDGTYWVVLAETQPWVTKWAARNPGAHIVPNAFTSYYDKPDTAYASLPATLDTGQPITYSPQGVATQPTITSGALVVPRGVTGTNVAAYMNLDASSGNTLTRIGVKFRLDNTGATTSSSVAALAFSNYPTLNGNGTAYRIGVHLIVGSSTWTLTKATNATGTLVFTTLGSGSLQNNLESNNLTEYTIELWRVGNTATAILPDGQRIFVGPDVDIGAWSTQYGFFEPAFLDTTDSLPSFTEVWYGVNTQYPPGDTGLVRRDDIINERTFTRTLTNTTLTAPKINYILDSNGFPVLSFTAAASAANYMLLENRAAGSPPDFAVAGSDTNIDISFVPKGTGGLQAYLTSGTAMKLQADGAPTDVGWNLTTKGAGLVKANNVAVLTTSDGLTNNNTARQSQVVVSATSYYITNSNLNIPATPKAAMAVGTKFVWTVAMDKTAAGTGTFQIIIYRGTNGTTADTADVTQTIGTQTAAVDNMTVDVELVVTTTGATGAYYWTIVPNNKAITATGFGVATGTGAYFSGTVSSVAMNTASLKFGLGFKATTGTPTITIPMVKAQAFNIY